uniref:non-specific serine/threonine protein kinase n=1 Tax=Hanusia phi TaxID=3032 RepID=A0A7S0EH67_9CRYP|mmetsp:Transcript_23397/g.52552  ORF Transcript_23397/g.52552 Transcript_23397/m.52552 type:complete len:1301 (+) Transcript_23397:78-3980(+)
MSSSSQEFMSARARQLQADVLVHEVYESGGSNMSNESFGSSDSDFRFIPNEAEMEHYARVLNNPGQIMPHGVFLLVDESDKLKIKAASSNTDSILGWPYQDLLGKEMLDLFEEKQRIETALVAKSLDLVNPITVSLAKRTEDDIGGTVNLIMHRGADGLVVDIEQLDPSENAFAAHQRVRAAIDRLNMMDSQQKLCEQVCNDFFDIFGYDRVMVYYFHEDCHGEVVAERTVENLAESYLGLHYPATDLPQRIRDQYKSEHVRLIMDSNANHSDIMMMDKTKSSSTISLGGSTLRRAHKCHLEYLNNMGVTASIGLALVVKDQLWGLIIGHHMSPKFVSYQMRMAGDFLAQAFSMRVANLLDLETHKRHDKNLELHAKLCDIMSEQGMNPGLRLKGLVSSAPNLMDLVPGVSGAAVSYQGRITSVGQTPGQSSVRMILNAVQEKWLSSSDGKQVCCWDKMSDLHESFETFSNIAAGVLVVPVLEDGVLLLFRPELSTTIRWAGNPAAPASREKKTGAMHPRASFDIFSDAVKGQCAPWLKWQVDAASGLGLLVNDLGRGSDLPGTDLLERVADAQMKNKTEASSARTEMIHLMDSVKAPVFGLDCDLRVVQWNNMCVQLTGFAKEEAIGKFLIDLVPKMLQESLQSVLKHALRGEQVRGYEFSISKARASELPVIARQVDLLLNASGKYDTNGVCTGVNCVCQDITMQKMSKGKQDVLGAQLEQISKLAIQMQPNGFDATEAQFEFLPNKEDALLGEGAFGKTYRMKNTIDDMAYAVKMINVKKLQRNGMSVQSLKREVQMLLQLNSSNIVRYYTCFMRKNGKYFCIVMELAAGGTLSELVKKRRAGEVPEERVRLLVHQMAKALAHIHSKRMLHRDLKPDNVLLSGDGMEIKVTDFGLACVASSAGANSRAGTLTYSSPEKAGSKGYDSKDDIWALGCILVELITGVPLGARCAGGVFAFNKELIARTIAECKQESPRLGSVVEMLLSLQPNTRPTAEEVAVMLETKKSTKVTKEEAEEFCEEYLCSICQSLVVDAHTMCEDDHVFCGLCLKQWLKTKQVCPTCRKPSTHVRRQKIVNNVAEKLAQKFLSPEDMEERKEKQKASEAAMAEEASRVRNELTESARGAGEVPWVFRSGVAQLGSGCTLLLHPGTGALVELFHINGWFRFRADRAAEPRWCNSCCIIGESDFGAPDIVEVLDAGQGQTIPYDGIEELNQSDFWTSRVRSSKIVLSNADEETLILLPEGGIIWLSHYGMDKGLVVKSSLSASQDSSAIEVMTRDAARSMLGSDVDALLMSTQSG